MVILSILSFHISASGSRSTSSTALWCRICNRSASSPPRARSARKSFQSQHQLMLAGFKSYLANSKLTERKRRI
jgi:hypothetical protein